MSYRGSFTTGYMYCDKCFEAAKTLLLGNTSGLCSLPIPSWIDPTDPLPIIAGKLSDTYPAGEVHRMQLDLLPRLRPLLCHDIQVVVVPEDGDPVIFVVGPTVFKMSWTITWENA